MLGPSRLETFCDEHHHCCALLQGSASQPPVMLQRSRAPPPGVVCVFMLEWAVGATEVWLCPANTILGDGTPGGPFAHLPRHGRSNGHYRGP
jgi:hypothetical protein